MPKINSNNGSAYFDFEDQTLTQYSKFGLTSTP